MNRTANPTPKGFLYRGFSPALLFFAAALFCAGGCVYSGGEHRSDRQMSGEFSTLTGAASDMASGLVKNAAIDNKRIIPVETVPKKLSPIVVTTFVDINDFERTSPLGRTFSEMMMSELQARNFKVIEMRKGAYISMQKDKGEFILSRDIENTARKYNATAVMTGTYTSDGNSIILSGRIISIRDNQIYSAWTNRITLTEELGYMMRSGRELPVTVFERMPAQ
jgi:TolB-like protein